MIIISEESKSLPESKSLSVELAPEQGCTQFLAVYRAVANDGV